MFFKKTHEFTCLWRWCWWYIAVDGMTNLKQNITSVLVVWAKSKSIPVYDICVGGALLLVVWPTLNYYLSVGGMS